jgi:hypothetical protein
MSAAELNEALSECQALGAIGRQLSTKLVSQLSVEIGSSFDSARSVIRALHPSWTTLRVEKEVVRIASIQLRLPVVRNGNGHGNGGALQGVFAFSGR